MRLGLIRDPISSLLKTMLLLGKVSGLPSMWNIMNFVLDVLTVILLLLNQLDNFWSLH